MSRYAAILDIYALVATYPAEAEALVLITQLTALSYLQRKTHKRELVILLLLARDLGYITADAYELHIRFL
jgi:hypothetical protein